MEVAFYLKSFQTFKEKAANLPGSRVFECIKVKDGADVRLNEDDPAIAANPREYAEFKAAIAEAGEENVFAEVRERGEWRVPVKPRNEVVVKRELKVKQSEVSALEKELEASQPEAEARTEEKPRAKAKKKAKAEE